MQWFSDRNLFIHAVNKYISVKYLKCLELDISYILISPGLVCDDFVILTMETKDGVRQHHDIYRRLGGIRSNIYIGDFRMFDIEKCPKSQ